MIRPLLLTMFLLLAPAMQGLSVQDVDIAGDTEVSLEIVSMETIENEVFAAKIAEKQAPSVQVGGNENSVDATEMDLAWLEDLEPQQWLAEQLDALPIHDRQAPGIEMLRFMAQPNGTNETVLNSTGTETHTHGGVGGNGLFEGWAVDFYGETRIIVEEDLNGDGVNDALLGTNSAVVAISGSSGEMMWAYQVGNRITSLEYLPEQGQILYSTLWEGQLGEVGLLGAMDGHVAWKEAATNHYLRATAHDDGILLATIDGFVHKIDFQGNVLWSYDTRTIPDVSAIVAAHVNMGTYLAENADFNGDGIEDMAVATLNYRFVFGLYVYSFEFYTQIHAVNGADGSMLWIGQENADPVLGISINALADLEAFDARGDGTMDLAYDGLTLRWYMLPLVPSLTITYETYIRALDGDSTLLAQPLGGRTLGGALLPLELYGDIERVDANGDGKEEVAVIRLDVAQALLGDSTVVESYSFLPHAPDNGATMVLSDVTLRNGNGVTLSAFDGNGRQLFLGNVETNDGLLVESGLQNFEELTFDAPALVGSTINGQVAIATKSHFIMAEAQTALRGVPQDVFAGTFDQDGTPDFFIPSSDGFLYAIDGINGEIAGLMAMPGNMIHVQSASTLEDAQFVFYEDSYDGTLMATTFDGEEIWSAYVDGFSLRIGSPLPFDGNQDGVMDYLVGSNPGLAINGRTGSNLWAVEDNYGYFPDEIVALENGDIVIVDYRDITVINGANGKPRVFELESVDRTSCIGGMPTDDGIVPIAIGDNWFGDKIFVYELGATVKDLGLINGQVVFGCHVQAYNGGALISVTYLDNNDEVRRTLLRVLDGEVVWTQTNGGGNMFEPMGYDQTTNRVFASFEDHVRGFNWTTGETEVDFTANGPFMSHGVLANVDRLGGKELVSVASNGIVWMVSQSEDVQETLVRQAELQGKTPLQQPVAVAPEAKESPVGFALLLLGLLFFATRRR